MRRRPRHRELARGSTACVRPGRRDPWWGASPPSDPYVLGRALIMARRAHHPRLRRPDGMDDTDDLTGDFA